MTFDNLKCYIERLMSTKPMFEVSAVLLMSEIVLEPTANELQSVIIMAAKDFLQRCVALSSPDHSLSTSFLAIV